MRPIERVFGAVVMLAWLSVGAPVRALEVDLELVLALDVSRSMDAEELELQKQGYAAAFMHPAVISALRSGPLGRIAVTVFEWAGESYQQVVVPWTVVADDDDAENIAAAILAAPKFSYNFTSISGAIDFGRRLFPNNGLEGTRKVIDISGDGINNAGRPVFIARDEAIAEGITINGLVIMNDRGPGGGLGFGFAQPRLDVHYRENVIGGPGAFLMVAEDFSTFAFAIRNKLIREIAGIDGPSVVIATAP
jgi:hypothetical protein